MTWPTSSIVAAVVAETVAICGSVAFAVRVVTDGRVVAADDTAAVGLVIMAWRVVVVAVRRLFVTALVLLAVAVVCAVTAGCVFDAVRVALVWRFAVRVALLAGRRIVVVAAWRFFLAGFAYDVACRVVVAGYAFTVVVGFADTFRVALFAVVRVIMAAVYWRGALVGWAVAAGLFAVVGRFADTGRVMSVCVLSVLSAFRRVFGADVAWRVVLFECMVGSWAIGAWATGSWATVS